MADHLAAVRRARLAVSRCAVEEARAQHRLDSRMAVAHSAGHSLRAIGAAAGISNVAVLNRLRRLARGGETNADIHT